VGEVGHVPNDPPNTTNSGPSLDGKITAALPDLPCGEFGAVSLVHVALTDSLVINTAAPKMTDVFNIRLAKLYMLRRPV